MPPPEVPDVTLQDIAFVGNQAIGGKGGDGNGCGNGRTGGGGGGGFGFVDGSGFRIDSDDDGNGGYGAGGGLNRNGGTFASGQLPGIGGEGGSRGSDGSPVGTGTLGGTPTDEGAGGGGGGRGGDGFGYEKGEGGGNGSIFGGGGGAGGGCGNTENGGNGGFGAGGGGDGGTARDCEDETDESYGWSVDPDGNPTGLGGNGALGVFFLHAGGGGGGGAGLGGAIFAWKTNLRLDNCTFSNNTVAGGTGGASIHPDGPGGNGQAKGAAIYVAEIHRFEQCGTTLGSNQVIDRYHTALLLDIPNPTNVNLQAPSEICTLQTGNASISFPGIGAFTGIQWELSGNGQITGAGSSVQFTAGNEVGIQTLTVRVSLSTCTFTFTKEIQVNGAPAITASAPAFVCASSTGNQASAQAGLSNYSWAITGGTITAGADSQVVTYTAGASGNVFLTVTATAPLATCPSTKTVLSAITQFENATSPLFSSGSYTTPIGVPIGTTFTANNLSIITHDGTLPAGVGFAQVSIGLGGGVFINGGRISGTPTQAGTFQFRIITTNEACSSALTYTLIVTCDTLAITAPNPFPTGVQGIPYSVQLGPTLNTFTHTGTLPNGVTLSPQGLLSGTPTEAGTFPITVMAYDAVTQCSGARSFNIVIECQFLTLLPVFVSQATSGVTYAPVQFTRPGATNPTFTFTGTLPQGMTLSSSGLLSGIPVGQPGEYTFTLTANDANGCPVIRSYMLALNCATASPFAITPTSIPTGTVGSPYPNTNISTSGGSASFKTIMKLTGDLPTGMFFNGQSGSGTINGTPSEPGVFPITVSSVDTGNGCAASQSYLLIIKCSGVTIQTGPATLADSTNRAAYPPTTIFNASGGVAPYSYLVHGSLPPGMSITNGSLSGTPEKAGTFHFSITATDANGCPGITPYTLTIINPVTCGAITINPTTVPDGVLNQPYAGVTFSSTGGNGAVTFSTTSTLPAGMTFANGMLSGAPTAPGVFAITVVAEDFYGCLDSKTYHLVIPCGTGTITIDPATLAAGTVGSFYSQSFVANGSQQFPSQTWKDNFFFVGTLPAGLSYSNGTITGTPTQSGSFPIRVIFDHPFIGQPLSDCVGTRDYTLVVSCNVTVNPATLPNAVIGTPYSQSVSGSPAGNYNYSVANGTLPDGLSLNSSTGAITGTPTILGTSSFRIGVTLGGCTVGRDYSITVGCQSISITTTSLPTGTAGSNYSQSVGVSPSASYYFSITDGSLPSGITLNPSTGAISGTSTVAGNFNFTVKAQAANGCFATQGLSLTILCPTISLSPTTLTNGTFGTAYSQSINATPAGGSYSFAVTGGALPAGLSLNAAGSLTGTPTQSGTFNFQVTATGFGNCSGFRNYAVTIECPVITVNPSSLPGGTALTPYSQSVNALPAGSYSFSVASGSLPAGVTLDSSTGALTGTPTTPGTYDFRITATWGPCSGFRDYQIIIACQSISVTGTLPSGTVGSNYSQAVNVTPSASYTFSISQGSLPTGLSIDGATGVISGVPTAAANYNFTVKALASNGCFGTREFSITVSCPTVTVSPAAVPNGTFGSPYSQSFTAIPAGLPFTFAVSGNLPAGLSLNTTTGALTGTPTETGAFSIRITASAYGCSGYRDYSLIINCPTITLDPVSLAGATAHSPYAQTVSASPAGSYTFSLSLGSLPPGLSLNPATGAITGTATIPGPYNFTITATWGSCTRSRDYTIVVACQTITVTTISLPAGTVGSNYSQGVSASPAASYTFSVVQGTMPSGYSINPSTGVISGTTLLPGTYNFTVKALAENGCFATQALSLVINCPTLTFAPASLPNGQLGSTYNQSLSVAPVVGTQTYSKTGNLPPGLSLNANTGRLSGKPTAKGVYNFTVTATSSTGCTGSKSYTLIVTPGGCPTITLPAIPNGQVGTLFMTYVTPSPSGPYTYSLTGTVPPGVTFDPATGLLTGYPTTAGIFNFTVTALNTNSCGGSRAYAVAISP